MYRSSRELNDTTTPFAFSNDDCAGGKPKSWMPVPGRSMLSSLLSVGSSLPHARMRDMDMGGEEAKGVGERENGCLLCSMLSIRKFRSSFSDPCLSFLSIS